MSPKISKKANCNSNNVTNVTKFLWFVWRIEE